MLRLHIRSSQMWKRQDLQGSSWFWIQSLSSRLAMLYGDLALTRLHSPPTRPYRGYPKEDILRNGLLAGLACQLLVLRVNSVGNPLRFFFLWNYFPSHFVSYFPIPILDMTARQRNFKIRIFVPLIELPSLVVVASTRNSWLWATRYPSSPIIWLGAELICQRLFEMRATETFYRQ